MKIDDKSMIHIDFQAFVNIRVFEIKLFSFPIDGLLMADSIYY